MRKKAVKCKMERVSPWLSEVESENNLLKIQEAIAS